MVLTHGWDDRNLPNNIVSMVEHCLRRWPTIQPTLHQRHRDSLTTTTRPVNAPLNHTREKIIKRINTIFHILIGFFLPTRASGRSISHRPPGGGVRSKTINNRRVSRPADFREGRGSL